MEIAGKSIGDSVDPYFIAEAGVNHNGDLELAKQLIEIASDSGADAVKFQTFSAERLVSKKTSTTEYQQENTGIENQQQMLQKYELDRSEHRQLIECCEKKDITFLSTPFDQDSADMLVDLDVPAIKLGSGELDNHPLIEHVAEYNLPLIISTGMGTMEEVHAAYESVTSIDPEADIVFLHCTSAYPCDISDVHLRAMQTMDDELPTPVGYSDHTTLPEMSGMAVAAGACVVEKHFTVDSSLPGPDHEASLESDELKQAVELVNVASQAQGTFDKNPVEAEITNKKTSRKSIHAADTLESGTELTRENLRIIRPAEGISPSKFQTLLGKKITEDVEENEPITEQMVS